MIDDSGQHVGGKGNWGNCGPKCPIPPSPKDIASERESPKKGIKNWWISVWHYKGLYNVYKNSAY